MSKMTVGKRNTIVKRAVDHRFAAEIAAADELLKQIGDEIYDDSFSDKSRSVMKGLPDGWLPEVGSIGVQFGETSSNYVQVSLTDDRRIPYNKYRRWEGSSSCVKIYPDMQTGLGKKWLEQKAIWEDLKKQAESMRIRLECQLSAFTTVPSLIKAWPEIEPFTTGMVLPKVQLPAIAVAELNAALKLPVTTA